MTKEELAAQINGREYGLEITQKEIEAAEKNNLLIVFGRSDDLIELYGAINDEFGAYGGTNIALDEFGDSIYQFPGQNDYNSLVKRGWTPPKHVMVITIEFAPKNPKATWLLTTDIPFAPFDIMEDDKLYCRGFVADWPGVMTKESDI